MAKVKLNLSLDPDTKERLEQYAFEQHKTVSQAVTDWIWKEKVQNNVIRGQLSMDDVKKGRK